MVCVPRHGKTRDHFRMAADRDGQERGEGCVKIVKGEMD